MLKEFRHSYNMVVVYFRFRIQDIFNCFIPISITCKYKQEIKNVNENHLQLRFLWEVLLIALFYLFRAAPLGT